MHKVSPGHKSEYKHDDSNATVRDIVCSEEIITLNVQGMPGTPLPLPGPQATLE